MKESELLIAEMLIKLTAMERLLIKAGIFSSDELTEELKKVSEEVVSFIKKNYTTINPNN